MVEEGGYDKTISQYGTENTDLLNHLAGCGDTKIERRLNMAEAKDSPGESGKGPILPRKRKF
jgi:hypothetical protein